MNEIEPNLSWKVLNVASTGVASHLVTHQKKTQFDKIALR